MTDPGGRNGDTQSGNPGKGLRQKSRISPSRFHKSWQFPQDHPADSRLYLCESPICSERLVKPAKPWGMLTIVNGIVTLAMVLEAPRALPNPLVIGREHAPFSAGRHDFVLTKGKSGYISERTDRAAFVSRAVGLRTVFNHFESASPCEFQNRIHITRPPCQVYSHNGLRPRREEGPYGIRSYVLAIGINIGYDRSGAAHHCTTRRGDEGPAWNDYLIARPNP